MHIRPATTTDLAAISKLLLTNGLQTDEQVPPCQYTLVACHQQDLIATASLEQAGADSALLKSVAVAPHWQGQGIGRQLVYQLMAQARLTKIQRLFLLTSSAVDFFQGCGFCLMDREQVPVDIAATEQFSRLCPSSASCLSLDLAASMHYYPKESLQLKDDIDGVRLWSVCLQDSQFTYFEVEANRQFAIHSHASEQITYILEGELYFHNEKETICVGPGEAIAIPANLRHGAFTKDKPLKAVDSWAPINPKYS